MDNAGMEIEEGLFVVDLEVPFELLLQESCYDNYCT
jgi:hypothetical protein